MPCDYSGSDYNQAAYCADIKEYEQNLGVLNLQISTYNNSVDLVSSKFEEAMHAQKTADMSKFLKMDTAYKMFSLNAQRMIKEGNADMNTAQSVVKETRVYDNYSVLGPPFQSFYSVFYSGYISRTYSQAIAHLNVLADRMSEFSSWSFSFNIGSFGGFQLDLNASNILNIVDMTLQIANEIGLISDANLIAINGNPLYKASLVSAANYGLEEGGASISSGFSLETFAKNLASKDIEISIGQMAFESSNDSANYLDNIIEELENSRTEKRSKHNVQNRFMVLDNMLERADKKYNRIAYQRIRNSEYKEKYGDSIYSR